MAVVLIIDDDEMFCHLLAIKVQRLGHEALCANSLAEGLKIAEQRVDVIFLDLGLPDGSGLEALPGMRDLPSRPEIIIITGGGTPRSAELAFRIGAWDYLEKPFEQAQLELSLLRAVQYREEKLARRPKVLKREEIIGRSAAIQTRLELVAQAAASNASVLITGETGTGKEVFARAIHQNSPRADRNFVVVDCASLPETLVESVLFGHVKGAFTGADRSNEGLVRQADNGTLFLDEIGELPESVQKSFLRVLQEHRFRPVGSDKEQESHFRLLAATNRDLEGMAQEGRFRQDLLFRISALTIELAPLREHPEDIKDLLSHYLTRLCEEYHRDLKGYTPEFLTLLEEYPWPGNVRELMGALETAVAAAGEDPTLYPVHLPYKIRAWSRLEQAGGSEAEEPSAPPQASPAASAALPVVPEPARIQAPDPNLPPLKDYRQAVVDQAERAYLETLMARTEGRVKDACQIAGLSEPRLYALLKKYGQRRARTG